MRTERVTIPTDTLPLDGAFYEPDGGATAGAVLLLHRNTMNFYVGAPRFLPPALTATTTLCCAAGAFCRERAWSATFQSPPFGLGRRTCGGIPNRVHGGTVTGGIRGGVQARSGEFRPSEARHIHTGRPTN
jgi:hypothetical protein